MVESVVEIIRRHCRPLAPQPTTVSPLRPRLPNIQAVMFDIYGTMLVSGAGDITLQSGTSSDAAFRACLVDAGLPAGKVASLTARLLKETVAEHHAVSRERGIEFPEVNIVEVWRDVLPKIADRAGEKTALLIDPGRLAVDYEVRVNPVWPMPGLLECLEQLRRRRLRLGIVSNAQAMTPELFPALLGRSLDDLGFPSDMQFFSYRHGEAKPGRTMFAAAREALAGQGVDASAAIYIGNDMLNDVWAAQREGFRTALFAGDQRSLRFRDGDARMANCTPDCVVVDLLSLLDCLKQ